MKLKTNLLAALVAASAMLISTNTSFAWGHHGGSCGSYGGGWCGSYGGSWGGWGSGGSYGGSWGGGSCGSCGSCGSYGGGYAYSGGYYSGGYASSRVIYDGVVSDSSSTSSYASAPTVRTSLTIHVPAEAKLTLAGVDTKQNGEIRQFATNKLTAGQTWDGYKVVAEMQRDGKTLRQEQTIKLIGGEAQELSINFDSSNKVASN
jgi:uncharacterized protein (TIGR03000 family)